MNRRSACAVLVIVLALAGCGVTAQSTTQPLIPPAGASLRTPTHPAEVTASGQIAEYLYFVDGDKVVKVVRAITGQPTTDEVVADLLAGPNDTESAAGYTSALLGGSVVSSVQVNQGHAVVALVAPVIDTARNDAIVAYAQLVCTLTALSQISGVTFTSNGRPVNVPQGDGSLLPLVNGQPVPLTADDYTDLIQS